jgi:hypothetical protein
LEHGANQVFVLPSEAAKQNGDAVALFGRERPLDRPMEVTGRGKSGLLPQTDSFGREALLEFLILVNLYESRCHVVSLIVLSLPETFLIPRDARWRASATRGRRFFTECFLFRLAPAHSACH